MPPNHPYFHYLRTRDPAEEEELIKMLRDGTLFKNYRVEYIMESDTEPESDGEDIPSPPPKP